MTKQTEAEIELRKYWFHAGLWHIDHCAFIMYDAGVCNCKHIKLKKEVKSILADIDRSSLDPFNFVQPCEPECTDVRHAYHQGQWDMAVRMEAELNKPKDQGGI